MMMNRPGHNKLYAMQDKKIFAGPPAEGTKTYIYQNF